MPLAPSNARSCNAAQGSGSFRNSGTRLPPGSGDMPAAEGDVPAISKTVGAMSTNETQAASRRPGALTPRSHITANGM